jgi:hypothetical protein
VYVSIDKAPMTYAWFWSAGKQTTVSQEEEETAQRNLARCTEWQGNAELLIYFLAAMLVVVLLALGYSPKSAF